MWPQYCNEARYYWDAYWACKNKKPICPSGFVFDGANCYSKIHIPQGYSGFIWGPNGDKWDRSFYVKPNCNISRANNCCPSGTTYDGANCRYYNVYVPAGWEPFIWNGAFYVKPKC